MDNLLSSLSDACGQCQEQARESSFGLLAFHQLKFAEARLDYLTAGRQSLSPTQRLRLSGDKIRQVLAQLRRLCPTDNLPNRLRRSFAAPRYRPSVRTKSTVTSIVCSISDQDFSGLRN